MIRLGQNRLKKREQGSAPAKKTRRSLVQFLLSRFLIRCLPILGVFGSAVATPVIATSLSSSDANASEALSYYLAEVDPGVQSQCLVCHKAGSVAPQAGARLVLGDDPESNHNAFLKPFGPDRNGRCRN